MWEGRHKQSQNWYLDALVKQVNFGNSLCNLVRVPPFKGHASWSHPLTLDRMNQGHFTPSICQLEFSLLALVSKWAWERAGQRYGF